MGVINFDHSDHLSPCELQQMLADDETQNNIGQPPLEHLG